MEQVGAAAGLMHESSSGRSNEQELPETVSVGQDHARETLARSQKRFRYAFLTSPDSVAIIRAEDEIFTEINEMFCIFLGCRKKNVIGKTFSDLAFWANREEQQKLLAEVENKGPVINREARFIDSQGEVKTGLLSVMAMPLDREPHFVLAIRKTIFSFKSAKRS